MLRQPLVDEGVVGVEQIEHRTVFPQDALEQQFRFALECLTQVVVEIGEEPVVRSGVLQVAEIEPLAGEVGDERAGLRVGKHPSRLLFEHCRFVQPARDRAGSTAPRPGIDDHRKNDSREASAVPLIR